MPFFILLRLSDCVPGFAPVHANVGLHDCQLTFGRTEALLSVPPEFCGTFTRENIVDPHGAGLGAVALPKLESVGAVVGGEVERIVRDRETERTAAARPGIDVLDANGAGLGPVAPPQLKPARSVECGEVERVVEDCKPAGHVG